jgi:hypothetical protein
MRIIITDFDDTLFPSHDFLERGKENLEGVDESIKKLLDLFLKHGDKIFIITNGSTDWVRECLFLKLFIPVEMFENIEIISTVEKGHNQGDIWYWKQHAFFEVLDPILSDEEKHTLISFGDADWDRVASFNIKNSFPSVTVKHIKLIIQPTREQLLFQHQGLRDHFQYFLEFENEIDLEVHPSTLSTIMKSSESETGEATRNEGGDEGEAGNSGVSTLMETGEAMGETLLLE